MFPVIHWHLITLELLITTTIVMLVIVDMMLPKESRRNWLGILSYIALAIMGPFWLTQHSLSGVTFNDMFVMDSLAWFFKGFFLVAAAFIFVMTEQFFKFVPRRRNHFYMLLWFALLGMCLIASSADFLLLFISIEIMTLAFYVMTAYLKSDKHSLEAGMKYLILGALTSGFFLYGLSFLYGATHSTNFSVIQQYAMTHGMTPLVLFGLILIFATIGFKTSAVPFHLWVPDVYQGAPTPVTAFLSVGSKAAGFVILIRVFLGVFSAWYLEWSQVLAVLAAITMCYGNLGAMFQTNIKRLLGYSSIGHAGYLLMGAAAGSALGVAAINFYLLGYLFTNLAMFLVIVMVSLVIKSDELRDYAGLAKRSGLLAGVLLLALVSLAGVPPLAGFFGKFSLLMATVQAGYVWLALIAAANIVISLYYYLMVAKRLYVDEPLQVGPITVSSLRVRLMMLLAVLGIVGIGIFQGPFFEIAIAAVQGMAFTQP